MTKRIEKCKLYETEMCTLGCEIWRGGENRVACDEFEEKVKKK